MNVICEVVNVFIRFLEVSRMNVKIYCDIWK